MEIVLLLIGLVVLGYFVQKYTTRCPNCKKLGSSKRIKRTFVGKAYRSLSRNNSKRSNEYKETFACKNCGHQFSKRARSSRGPN